MVVGKSRELDVHAPVRLGVLSRPLGDERLGRMKCGQITLPCSDLWHLGRQDDTSTRETMTGLFEMVRRLGRQIDALAANNSHQRRAIAVGAGSKRHRVDESFVVLENAGHDRNDAVHLTPATVKIAEKDSDVVIGIPVGITPRARAAKDDALHPRAIKLVERGAKAYQNRIVQHYSRHSSGPARG